MCDKNIGDGTIYYDMGCHGMPVALKINFLSLISADLETTQGYTRIIRIPSCLGSSGPEAHRSPQLAGS